jgi:CPA2 family monovalent cation:H+ antiporter-2
LFRIPAGNHLIGQTLAEANFRAQTGASVIAILRDGQLMANPKSLTVFQSGDRIGLIGEPDEIESAERLLSESESESEQSQAGVDWET